MQGLTTMGVVALVRISEDREGCGALQDGNGRRSSISIELSRVKSDRRYRILRSTDATLTM